MAKASIKDFEKWCASADEYDLICAEAKLYAEIACAQKMLGMLKLRREYWDRYNFHDITKLAKSLEIEPPQASD